MHNTRLILSLLLASMFLFGTQSLFARELSIGVRDGKLNPCPKTPNCVCTFDNDKSHGIVPLRYEGSQEQAMARLNEIINALPRTQIISQTDNYMHVTFTSKFFKFVDDVEFLLDDEHKIIHFRSASRAGYSDLMVNRDRMEDIRNRFKP